MALLLPTALDRTDGSTRPARISRGRELPFIDGLANILSVPNKVLFGTTDFESHVIDEEIEASVEAFIAHHRLGDVHVRLNEYDPIGELGRLLGNARVSLLLRLTIGPLLWLAYLLNIGRLFGGDHYNPYSDTVNLYSGHKSIALHEMGHVLDFHRQKWPGLYGLIRLIPGIALYQEYMASLYAIEYLREEGDHAEEVRAYRVLFPAYSTYVFGTVIELLPSAPTRPLLLPIIALGHVLGNVFGGKRAEALAPAEGVALAEQWRDEVERAKRMFSPETDAGRGNFFIGLGLLLGSALCGPGALLGAWAGHLLARSNAAIPAHERL